MTTRKDRPEKRTANGAAARGKGKGYKLASYFLSLSLENVRCFGPKQTLELSDGNGKPARWTVILGLNGTGKTTLLQLLAGSELEPDPGPSALPFPHFLSSDFPNSLLRSNSRRARFRIEVAVSLTLGVSPVRLEGYSTELYPEGIVQCLGYEENVTNNPPKCCAYGAGRRMGAASMSESELDDATASLFSDKADLRNPEEWLLRLDYSATKPSAAQPKQQKLLAQIKTLLLSILPDDETTDIRFTSTSGTHPKPRVEFETPYGWVPLRQLGYGYQTLITWVADFANRMVERYPDSVDPFAEPAVVLVDEIDLHLHPQWQRKLLSFLSERFPNTQFIVTAHSPLVVQAAPDANLAVLKREGDHVVIENDLDNIRNLRVDQILTSELFGLATARPPQIESLILERVKLLSKSKLTAADQRRVKELEELIGELPYGETQQEIQERKLIRETLDLLMNSRQSSK